MKPLTTALWRTLSSWMARHGLSIAKPGNNTAAAELFTGPGQKFLHVGCGPARKPNVGPGFLSDEWRELRLDIDPAVLPDIVSNMLDMRSVPPASVDGVYSSHNIEHLYPHEVPVALAEFLRVLKPEGLLVLACPDLQSLGHFIAEGRLDQALYISPAGPIAPLDILYGHRPQLAQGNLFMAHHTGFTLRTLVDAVRAAGFPSVAGKRRETSFDLWIVASKTHRSEQEMQALADIHLP
ncbi:MAG: methyltransferase domain-containing protein [Methylococcaceae bacterium]|nr:methyltransferase domain-containing protein [Methylococcaceae bacterium]